MTRKHKIAILLGVDLLLILLANVFSYFFLNPYMHLNIDYVLLTSALQIVFYLIIGLFFKLFNQINRYTNLKEIIAITISTLVTFLLEVIVLVLLRREIYSGRYLFLAFIVSTFLIISSRIFWRVIIDSQSKNSLANDQAKNTLIIGAGESGSVLLHSLRHSTTNSDIRVVGFVDDDPNKYHTYLMGVKVLGTTEDLPKLVKKYGIEMITIATPSISPQRLQRIVDIITPLNIPFNSIPALEEVASGNISISKLKNIDVVDLLGREEVKLDMERISGQIQDKTILVTGAGGSIGSEICRQVLKFKPKKLLLVGHGENSIYLIHQELTGWETAAQTEIIPIIADIQDRPRILELVGTYQPDIIYHAAAHKHVPLMEYNPAEAVKNNVYGTKNVAEAAKTYQIKNFVMVSTDKAVNPPNVMGATKRIAEMIVMGLNEPGGTKFTAVRFGNVLGSRGSVIPYFRKQIEAGGPVTVTDFRMTRYFMTIPEASRLVIQSGALAKGGEIFILDMGEPVKILDLAKKMIELSGYTEKDIKIEESGIRPGEKLYEELLVSKEKNSEQVFEKIFVGNVKGFSYDQVMDFVENLPENPELLAKAVVQFAKESSK